MTKVVIVEKYPSNYNYDNIFGFEFTKVSLVNEKMNKVLKKDITLDIQSIKEDYDFVILVGKEACKFVNNITSVTEYMGYLLDDKYIALLNPIAVNLKPALKGSFQVAVESIIDIVSGKAKFIKKDYDIEYLDTEDAILKHIDFLLDRIRSDESIYIATDTETSALYPRDGYVLGVSLSYKKEQGVYLDSLHITEVVVERLQTLFNESIVVFHNAKFDMKFFKYHFNITFKNWEDTLLQHFCLDENNPHGLKSLCMRYTKLGDYDKELTDFKNNYCKTHGIRKGDFTYDLIPPNIIFPYACLDTAGTYELNDVFLKHIKENAKLTNVYENLLKKGTLFLLKVEENGIPIDLDLVVKYINDINEEIVAKTEVLYSYDEIKAVEKIKGALFNVNSVMHKRELFFNILGLTSTKLTETGAPSTDSEVIDELAQFHELPRIISDIGKLKKIKSTYLDKFLCSVDMDGHLRTGFNLHITTSGRLSSSGKLNAQQLPRKDKRPKKCIRAKKDYKIVSQDLRTAEMYVAGVLSGDKNLQKIFIDGVDYHGSMAVLKFNLTCSPNVVADLYPDLRQSAKTISFEILYKLNYNEPALDNFPKLKQWLQNNEEYIKTKGYIYSFFGRKRRLANVFSPSRKDSQHEVRSGINFLVQSVSSDINLIAGIEMQEWIEKQNLENEMKIFGLVHDSILAEVQEEYVEMYTQKLQEITQKDRGLSIPGTPIGVDVEIGNNYAFKD